MKNPRILMALLVSLSFISFSQAQSQLLLVKESRAFVSGDVLLAENYKLLTLSGGYSFNGVFDLGLTIGSEQSNGSADFEYSGLVVAPYIGAQIVRESDEVPLGIRLGASIQSGNYHIDELEDLGIDYKLRGTGYNLGAMLNKRFSIGESFILSYLSVQHSSINLELELAGDKVTERDEDTNLSIGSSLVLESNLVLDLSIGLTYSGVSLGVGYLF